MFGLKFFTLAVKLIWDGDTGKRIYEKSFDKTI